MADQRADLSTRIAGPDEWDAGFHTDSEVGAIDVGLSVQPRAVGVVVDAPGIGTLRVAFDVGTDGTTRLARGSRKLGDGREAPFVAVDEAQVLRLEGELRRVREDHDALVAERDARISALEAEGFAQKSEFETVSSERDSRQAALELAQTEIAAASERITTLESERDTLRASSAQLGDRDGRIAALESQVTTLLDRAKELEAERDDLLKRLAESVPADQFAEREARITALESERTELKLKLEASAPVEQLAAVETERDALRAKLDTSASERDAQVAALESERDELRAKLETTTPAEQVTERDAKISALEAERDELRAKLEAAAPTEKLTALEAERDELRAKLEAAAPAEKLTALEIERDELRAKLEATAPAEQLTERDAKISALEAQLAERDAQSDKQSMASNEQSALVAKLEKRVKELQQAEAASRKQLADMVPVAELDAARAELEKLRNDPDVAATRERVSLLESDLGRREESLSMAVARSDALQGQLSSLEGQLKEARDVALSLKTQSDKMLAERDEARSVARSLHQKLNVGAKGTRELSDLNVALGQERQIAANLVKEKETLAQKLEALGRLVEQERNGRTQALAERDEWQSRFKALAKGATDTSQPLDLSREETRSYTLEQPAAELPTHPEIPAVKGAKRPPVGSVGDATDPMITKPKGK